MLSVCLECKLAGAIGTIGVIGKRRGFTERSQLSKKYNRKIDALYYSTINNKDECLDRLHEIRLEVLEIQNKGAIGDKEYEALNAKISNYIDSVNKS